MADIFDSFRKRRRPSRWDKRPRLHWRRRPARRNDPVRDIALLLLGVFTLGALIAYAATNFDRAAIVASIEGMFAPGRPEYAPAPSRPIRYTAVDGDSLRAGNEQIRLLGIDAPEYRQTCRDERGREWACGRDARTHLQRLLSRGPAQCVPDGRDRYGRTLARCSAGDIPDLGEAMVRAGYAIDFMDGGYGAAEAAARVDRRGIWRGDFQHPADWRRAHPRSAQNG